MAREDWDIKGIAIYCDFNDPKGPRPYDVYAYTMKFGDIPVYMIRELLYVSKQEFVDILNTPTSNSLHLKTSMEEEFRLHEKNSDMPFFTRDVIFENGECYIDVVDFEKWIDDNYHLLRWNNIKKDSSEGGLVEKFFEDTHKLLEIKDEEIANLKVRIAELENSFQIGTEGKEKQLSTREKNTLLKLVHAAVELDGKRTIEKRGLAGELARKTEELYPDARISERTVSDKLKEILGLEK